ncbi:MAG: carboxypeptidase regulatory-like domain-containing protein [Chloracidobacterium sp.]|nr:carboxypeptidase regulatory-like domain-containing protein [Chloracidobacterium sp.]
MQIVKRIWFAASVLFALAAVTPAFGQTTGGVKGKVRDLKGTFIAGATIEARQGGEVVRSTRSNAKGDFVLDGLAEGMYNFAVDADGYSTGVMHNVEVKKKKVRDLGSRLMLSPDRGTQTFIRGIVFFKELLSLHGAMVELFAVNSDGSYRKVATGTSNQMGEFGFVQPGKIKRFRVKATYKGISAEKTVETESPAVYRLTLTLDLSRAEQ